MVLVTDLILLFSFQGTKYEKLRGEIHKQETAQEILRKQELKSREVAQGNSHSTRRTSFEERNILKYVSTAENE